MPERATEAQRLEAQRLAELFRGHGDRQLPVFVDLFRLTERRRVWARLERLWAREQQGAS